MNEGSRCRPADALQTPRQSDACVVAPGDQCGQNPRLSSTGREWRRRACATAVAKPTWWRMVETGTPVGFWEKTEFFRLFVLEFEKDWGREASGATQAVAGRVFGRRDAWPGSTRAPDFRMDFRRTCRHLLRGRRPPAGVLYPR